MKHFISCLILTVSIVSIYSCNKDDNPVGTITWHNVLQGTSVSSICVSGNNLLAGSSGARIFLSTDNGSSWNIVATLHAVVSTPYSNVYLNPNVTIYKSGLYLFAGVRDAIQGSIYISTDNGLSWTEKDTNFIQCVNSFASISETVFAGTNDGVYLSTNNGINWSSSNTGLSYGNYNSIYGHAPQVVQLLAQGKTLFAGTSGEGIFRSDNDGLNWIEVDNGLTNLNIYGLTSIGPYLFAGAFQFPGDSTGGIYISTNNGTNWRAANTGLTNHMINILYADGSNLLAGTNIGTFLSTNYGTSWSILDSMVVTSFAVDRSNLLAQTRLFLTL